MYTFKLNIDFTPAFPITKSVIGGRGIQTWINFYMNYFCSELENNKYTCVKRTTIQSKLIKVMYGKL